MYTLKVKFHTKMLKERSDRRLDNSDLMFSNNIA